MICGIDGPFRKKSAHEKKSHRAFVTLAMNGSNTSPGIKCEFLRRLAGDSKRRWKKTSAPDRLKEKMPDSSGERMGEKEKDCNLSRKKKIQRCRSLGERSEGVEATGKQNLTEDESS